MENTIFKGDLYIKVKPTTVCELGFDIEKKELDMDISLDEMQEAIMNFISNFDEIIDSRNPSSKTTYDYSGNIGFYRLSFIDDLYRLTSEDNKIDGLYMDEDGNELVLKNANDYCEFETMDEVNEHFVSLSDFLLNSRSVGIYLEPNLDNAPRMVALYEYKDNYLVINEDGKYSVVSKFHPIMAHYTYGENINGKVDKKTVYLEVFKQRLSSNGLSR